MKVAVTSCAKLQQINPQPVWAEIMAEQPDVLLLLGDNIYLDHDRHTDPEQLRQELHNLYDAQWAEPNFSALLADIRQRGATLLAIYDDHDFLGNNRYGGDNAPALREMARSEFIRVFSPPLTGTDVYQVASFGGLLDIIVLDERFYRESPDVSRSDRDAILGARQWAWFEDAIANSNASYLMVASSSTFHSIADESWEQYPGAFDRLRQLLQKKPGKFIVSGDVHRNSLYDDSGVVEIVTSAVARNGLVFGTPRKNYGIFTFDPAQMRVQLRSLKAGWRFDVTIPRTNWQL